MAPLVDAVTAWLNKKKPLTPSELQTLIPQIQSYIENLLTKGTKNPFTKTPYMAIREEFGKNRGKELDALILRNGGSLGDPYCVFGLQDILRATEINFNIEFDLPRGGSVVSFYNQVKAEYKGLLPRPYSIACYRYDQSWQGHAGLSLSKVGIQEHSTFEFNTSPNATEEIVRDGEGAYFKVRNIQGFGKMKLMGFVYIMEAIKK